MYISNCVWYGVWLFFKLSNCVSLSPASDCDSLSSLSQHPIWKLGPWIQCVWKGTNEDSVKAVTGKWGRSKPWSRNWSFLLSLRNLMQQLTLIIHKHSRDQSRDLVHFKSGFKKTGSTPGYFQLEKLLYGWLLTIERETKAVGLLTISLKCFTWMKIWGNGGFFFHSTSGLACL